MPAEQNWFDTPIFVLNFNQVSFLRQQISWLQNSGYTNITVLDNHSTYAPVLSYYEEMATHGHIKVVRRTSNEHKRTVWEKHLQDHQGPFVLTTSDIVPDSCCPADVVARLASLLRENPQLFKAGLGLRIDNIPDHYMHRRDVLVKQSEYWRNPAASNVFLADIDFTFALYRCGSIFQYGPAVRTNWPYLARHEPWYSDSANRTEEELYYEATIKPGRGSWGRSRLPDWLRLACTRIAREPPLTLLHLASGRNIFPGWLNLDASPEVGADIVFDLNRCGQTPLPLAANSVDGFFIGHAFAQFEDILKMLEALYRIAKPDAHFIIRIPQPCPDSASPDRRYQLNNFHAWSQPGRTDDTLSYKADWRLERIKLVTGPGSAEPLFVEKEVAERLGSNSDTVREIVVHLRAVKPARAGKRQSPDTPIIEVNASPLDEHSTFNR